LFIPQMVDEYEEPWWNGIDRGNWKTWRQACSSATFSTTNSTQTDLSKNPGLLERLMINHLSHGMALTRFERRTLWSALKFEGRLSCQQGGNNGIRGQCCNNVIQLVIATVIRYWFHLIVAAVYSNNGLYLCSSNSGQTWTGLQCFSLMLKLDRTPVNCFYTRNFWAGGFKVIAHN
jgi:hypothetical protein